jgi:hypothetical protein
MYHAEHLDVPVPPMLEAAIGVGYDRATRFVAFYWTPAGDEIMIDDGAVRYDGDWRAWLTFTHDPVIVQALAAYDFGSSNGEAVHWLVLDRRERHLYAVPVVEAQQWLRDQHPRRALHELPAVTGAQVLGLLGQIIEPGQEQVQHIDQQAVLRRIAEQDARVTALAGWLKSLH